MIHTQIMYLPFAATGLPQPLQLHTCPALPGFRKLLLGVGGVPPICIQINATAESRAVAIVAVLLVVRGHEGAHLEVQVAPFSRVFQNWSSAPSSACLLGR